MRKLTLTKSLIFAAAVLAASCKKPSGDLPAPTSSFLDYGESVFYLKNNDYTVAPVSPRNGSYTAFPDDLRINPSTGVITVSEKGRDGEHTQMGLKYRILYTATDGTKDSTFIVLAGINFQDKIYNLSQNQNIARPIYNADPSNTLPTGNYGMRSNDKLVINPANGQIDLKASVNNGLFGDDPENDRWRVVTVRYKANDNSSDETRMDIIVYYYNTVSDIPSNVSEVMRAHQDLLLGLNPESIPVTNAPADQSIAGKISLGKPRPPCLVVIGH